MTLLVVRIFAEMDYWTLLELLFLKVKFLVICYCIDSNLSFQSSLPFTGLTHKETSLFTARLPKSTLVRFLPPIWFLTVMKFVHVIICIDVQCIYYY